MGVWKNISTNYNSALSRLLCISKPYSASNKFVSRGIPTFTEVLWKFYMYNRVY